MCSPASGALVGSGCSSPTTLIGDGTCSCPTRSCGIHGRRSWNCGSSARVLGVLTGAIGVLARLPRSIHSPVVRLRKIVGELGAELGVAARVVGVLRPGMLLEQVGAVDGPAEVLPELALGRHEEDVAVGRLVELVAHAVAHAGGAGRAALVAVGLVPGDLASRAARRPSTSRCAASPSRPPRRTGRSRAGTARPVARARVIPASTPEGAEQRTGVDARPTGARGWRRSRRR